MSTHEHSPVTDVSEAARAVRRSPAGGAFIRAVETYGDALSAIREHNPAEVTDDELRRLQQEAERVIEAIERRIDSGQDRASGQLALAEAVYGVRRKMEKLTEWHQHHRESPA